MDYHELALLKPDYLAQYKKMLKLNPGQAFSALSEKRVESGDFDYYLASSSVYSSNIEGNTVDFDSYFKSKTFSIGLKKKEVQEIDDLSKAYLFAGEHGISVKNLLHAHSIFAESIISHKKEIGKFRNVKVGVGSEGKLVYLAIEPEFVKTEMDKLFSDMQLLLKANLEMEEIFYFASMIHLLFVQIHPFVDGNGRATRLLEKWFLAEKLGKKAWNIESEKNYFINKKVYYKNLSLGGNYYVINYDLCLPFLLMLPDSLKMQ